MELKRPIAPIIGKRIILFELEVRYFDDFVKLHREDRSGYLNRFCLKKMTEDEARHYLAACIASMQIVPFTVITKEGKKRAAPATFI